MKKSKKPRGYIAGNLFNEAEVAQRIKEGALLRKWRPDVNWYNPIEAPINDKATMPTAADIFWGDTNKVLESSYFVADMTNTDLGTAYEMGIAWTINFMYKFFKKNNNKQAIKELESAYPVKKIVGVLSDIRVPTAGKYKDMFVPYGINQYFLGGCLDDGKVVHKFAEVEKLLKKKK